MDVSPLNLGMIAAYYNISCTQAFFRSVRQRAHTSIVDVTVEVYTLSLKDRTKLKGLLEVVSSSAEFETIPIRRHEESLLRRIYDRVPVKLDKVDFEAPHFKTFLLLQAHFSRLQLPPDLTADQVLVLEKVLNLLSACVDVMSSNAWLNALGAMDLSQMCVQAMWDSDSPLKQIPHFEPEVGPLEAEFSSSSLSCYLDHQAVQGRRCRIGLRRNGDGRRQEKCSSTNGRPPNVSQARCIKLIHALNVRFRRDVAIFVNSYPTLDVTHELVQGEYIAGVPIVLQVTLARDAEEDDDGGQLVVAPFYPSKKLANWLTAASE